MLANFNEVVLDLKMWNRESPSFIIKDDKLYETNQII